MAEHAAHLVDHVIPDVPVRQWVLSLPHRLRYRLAWDHDLCHRVTAVFLCAVFRLLRDHARAVPRSLPDAVVQQLDALMSADDDMIFGLAAGDALGTTLEFRAKGSFNPIDDMIGGGPFDLKAGQWTDDTSMALCLAESLIERGFWREGYWSSTGEFFDIGNAVRAALTSFERTGSPFAGSTDPNTAGNGSLMRIAPVPLRYARDAAEAVRRAGESSSAQVHTPSAFAHHIAVPPQYDLPTKTSHGSHQHTFRSDEWRHPVNLHQRLVACLLTCSVLAGSVGCSSLKTIHPVTEPGAPVFGKVQAGDTVDLQTRNGQRVRFVVQQIQGETIVSPTGERYTRGDIVHLQRRSFSGWKTASLIGGTFLTAMVVIAAAAVSALGGPY